MSGSRAIDLSVDPFEIWLDKLRELGFPSKSFSEIAAEIAAAGEEVPPMLAMLAREECAECGDPRFDALRAVWRDRNIQ